MVVNLKETRVAEATSTWRLEARQSCPVHRLARYPMLSNHSSRTVWLQPDATTASPQSSLCLPDRHPTEEASGRCPFPGGRDLLSCDGDLHVLAWPMDLGMLLTNMPLSSDGSDMTIAYFPCDEIEWVRGCVPNWLFFWSCLGGRFRLSYSDFGNVGLRFWEHGPWGERVNFGNLEVSDVPLCKAD
jgi:hypothetical protein